MSWSTAVLKYFVGIWVLISALMLGGTALAADPPAVDVPALLRKLEPDSNFEQREEAKKVLRDALLNNQLTTEQIALIREVAVGRGPGLLGTLEASKRVEQIFKEYVLRQPTVAMFQEFVQPMITRFTDTGGIQYRFGGDRGQVTGNNFQGHQDFNKFLELASSAVDNLTVGDTERANMRLEELKTFINGLPDDRFRGLGFRLNRQGFLRIVQQALDKIPQAQREILMIAGPPPGARLSLPIPGAALVNAGGTFTMDIQQVITPGVVDVTLPTEDAFLPTVPPEGYQFVGYSAFVIADEAIEIGGPLKVGFQYGPGLLFGHPVLNPDGLGVVRIANGTVQPLLDQSFNDPGAFMISASYEPPSRGSGLNQFGFFAVIQAIPEPSTYLLLSTGLLGIFGYTWRKRKPKLEAA